MMADTATGPAAGGGFAERALRTWLRPKQETAALLAARPREAVLLVLLMVAMLFLFMGQVPGLMRSFADPGPVVEASVAAMVGPALNLVPAPTAGAFYGGVALAPLESLFVPEGVVASAFFAQMLFAPLFFYGLAALIGLIARGIGGVGSWYANRLAVFWAVLVSAPVTGLLLFIDEPGLAALGSVFLLWVLSGALAAVHSLAQWQTALMALAVFSLPVALASFAGAA